MCSIFPCPTRNPHAGDACAISKFRLCRRSDWIGALAGLTLVSDSARRPRGSSRDYDALAVAGALGVSASVTPLAVIIICATITQPHFGSASFGSSGARAALALTVRVVVTHSTITEVNSPRRALIAIAIVAGALARIGARQVVSFFSGAPRESVFASYTLVGSAALVGVSAQCARW